jgi:hypothetical protein
MSLGRAVGRMKKYLMNKPLAALLLFVLLPSSCVLAQTNTRRDGNWWRDRSDIAKRGEV